MVSRKCSLKTSLLGQGRLRKWIWKVVSPQEIEEHGPKGTGVMGVMLPTACRGVRRCALVKAWDGWGVLIPLS